VQILDYVNKTIQSQSTRLCIVIRVLVTQITLGCYIAHCSVITE